MYTKKISEPRLLLVVLRMLWLAALTAITVVLFGSTAGLVVLGAGLLVGALIELRPARAEVHPLREPAGAAQPHRGRRVLVVANTELAGEDLAAELRASDAIDILAPPLPTLAHQAVSDIDHELDAAARRLSGSLRWARAHDLRASGEVGDPDPVTAIADELRTFGPDEVVVVHGHHDGRLPRRELEALRADLDVPVRELTV